MSGIFPIKRTVELDDNRGTRLVDIDESVADEVFEAFASETTRQIFKHLHDEPQTASDLAEATDTSLQNVQYHLEKLSNVDLVEVADTWYSERGTEMNVYAPTNDSLILFAGRDKQQTLRSLLKHVVAIVGVLLPASVLVGWIFEQDLVDTVLESAGVATGEALVRVNGRGQSGPETTTAVSNGDPALLIGLAFFLGGAFVVTVIAAVWIRHRRRKS